MSVIVKGMEPPENCCECDFNSGLCFPERHYYCECPSSATRGMNIIDAVDNDIKHPDCPISSLPKKHGRLVDVNDVKSRMFPLNVSSSCSSHISFSLQKWMSESDILKCETIVEAEGEG